MVEKRQVIPYLNHEALEIAHLVDPFCMHPWDGLLGGDVEFFVVAGTLESVSHHAGSPPHFGQLQQPYVCPYDLGVESRQLDSSVGTLGAHGLVAVRACSGQWNYCLGSEDILGFSGHQGDYHEQTNDARSDPPPGVNWVRLDPHGSEDYENSRLCCIDVNVLRILSKSLSHPLSARVFHRANVRLFH